MRGRFGVAFQTGTWRKSVWRALVVAAILAAVFDVGVLRGSARAASGGGLTLYEDGAPAGHVEFLTAGRAANITTHDTIPYWTTTFTSGGKSYVANMVGSNPDSNSTTVVPAAIIPMKFIFDPRSALAPSNPLVRDATPDVTKVLESPVFSLNDYNVGSGLQYGDAVQRATFNKTGDSGYHVILRPVVYPTQTINVPANLAQVRSVSARIDSDWFSNQMQQLMNQLHIGTDTVPIFLTHTTFLYIGHDTTNCCAFGFHGAGNKDTGACTVCVPNGSVNGKGDQPIQTFIYASYQSRQDVYGSISDVDGLTHEVSEWMNDPFGSNYVPTWTVLDSGYGCQNVLEVGDPLVGFSYPMTVNTPSTGPYTFNPQDMAIKPWFMRGSVSTAYNGQYTYPDDGATLEGEGAPGFTTTSSSGGC